MGTPKSEITQNQSRRRHGYRQAVLVKLGYEASISVGVVKWRAREGGALGDFYRVERAIGNGAEVGGGEGGVGGGAGAGVARNGGVFGDFGWWVCGVGFAFTEYAFEWGTGEPDEVAACVHVERDGLGRAGVESEGESVVTAWGEWERDLVCFAVVAAAVVVEAPG